MILFNAGFVPVRATGERTGANGAENIFRRCLHFWEMTDYVEKTTGKEKTAYSIFILL
jgi:hypothetical protein